MGLFNRSKKLTKPPSEVNSVAPGPQQHPGYNPQWYGQYGQGNQHQPPMGYSAWGPRFGAQPGYKGQQQQQHQQQYHHHQQFNPQPIVVNQYYISPQPSHQAISSQNTSNNMQLVHRPHAPHFQAAPPAENALAKLNKSVANAAHSVAAPDMSVVNSTWHDLTDINAITEDWHPHATMLLNQTAAFADMLATGFDRLMTSIDHDKYKGHEGDLFTLGHAASPGSSKPDNRPPSTSKPKRRRNYKGDTTAALAASSPSTSIISKVELYANARLPRDLPPLRLYMPTWPVLCLAAQYAERVYNPPSGAERHAHVASNWRTGTKAMVIKSVPMDHMSAIVFAIRGTATFADWAVNLNAAPARPRKFLDDESNLCHAGFLSVARSMVPAVASRLRQLLREDPSRAGHSLIITGHSAGGAVASLLYCHMLAEPEGRAASELTAVAGAFRRVHCVVFGTPPVSVRPLRRPERPELAKSLFLSFLNEGDPVARADKAYVRSLLELFASPAPKSSSRGKKEKKDKVPRFEREKGRKGSEVLTLPPAEGGGGKEKKPVVRFAEAPGKSSSDEDREKEGRKEKKRKGPIWKLPPSSLSSPGRIVVLRSGSKYTPGTRRTVEDRLNEGVIAQTVTDEELRGVVWGDPVCHVMRLYAGRIETLAVGAVTGKMGR